MSLASVAIIVASVSALFTGTNMAVSLATYRRSRPRVHMDAQWLPYIPPPGDYDGDEGIFLIHLINKSQTAVKVTKHFVRMEFDRPRIPFRKRNGALAGLKIVQGEEEKEIPPFGGIQWTAQTEQDSSRLVPHITRIRLTVVLSNRTVVRSKWIRKPSRSTWLTDEIERLQALLEQMPDRPRQLSFDELDDPQTE
ncbi:hypothetical protein AB0945_18855 [Streptomyces sp. NPDC005474]|uniref:hypothetical protein n=1 Tax=Streptomyces sp. NPDC005474 TaxID=3154878 RepID=UPI003455724E